MKEKLSRFLESNRDAIISEWKKNLMSEWHTQIAADSLSGNRGSTRVTSSLACECAPQTEEMITFLVNGFYDDLLHLALGRSMAETSASEQKFPHYTPFGVRLTLSYLLEIYFAGKNVFANRFLRNASSQESAPTNLEYFEECDHLLQLLTQHYTEQFCEECLNPLNTLISRVLEGSRLCEECKKSFYERVESSS
jgi:hypothetical protein